MTDNRIENVYSNIDPVTGSVASGGRVMLPGRNEYFKMASASSGYLPHDYDSSEWRPSGGFKKRIKHLTSLDFIFKVAELILLVTCASLYSELIHTTCDTIKTMILPMVTYFLFSVITIWIIICLAAKRELSGLFPVILHSLGVIMLFCSGGVIISICFSITKKVKAVYYWESIKVMAQMILSFVAGLLYLADLVLSLNSFNGRNRR